MPLAGVVSPGMASGVRSGADALEAAAVDEQDVRDVLGLVALAGHAERLPHLRQLRAGADRPPDPPGHALLRVEVGDARRRVVRWVDRYREHRDLLVQVVER